MSEYINNPSQRQAALKRMITQLHEGKSVEEVKSEFGALLAQVDVTEIAMLEQALIREGLPEMEIKRLCDVHVAAFEDALNARQGRGAVPAGTPGGGVDHPIATFRAANARATRALDALEAAIRDAEWDGARSWLSQLRQHETHYRVKENMLFPYLEKHGFSGPSSVMWAIHDDIRAAWKQLDALLAGYSDAARVAQVADPLALAVRQMFYKEENILFPMAMETLTQTEWAAIGVGLSEIGPGYALPGPAAEPEPAPRAPVAPALSVADGLIPLDTGALTAQQIALLLTHLPIDVTYVDENDEVRFFSATRERIFERLPAIIGRKVQQCHPPASIHHVQRILDDFRAGRRDVAEFWIQMGGGENGGKFVHIRYFAVRDEQGTYRGTLEVTQDIAAMRALQGERRLLAEGE